MEVVKHIDNVFTIDRFFSPEECDHFIELSEKIGYEIAAVETERGAMVIERVRNNQRLLYKDETLAAKLWDRLAKYAPSRIGNSLAIGLNDLFRFYKYQEGEKFSKHVDQSFIRGEDEASYYTFMIYLNDEFEGGETRFETIDIRSSKGMALIFRHSLPHEGVVIKSGIKYVLRTDIMYKLINADKTT